MAQLIAAGLQDLIPMDRSEGRHVSHAIRRACIQLGHFDDKDLPEDRTLLELGSAFEDLLGKALADRISRSGGNEYVSIGEQVYEGIYGTPDLVRVDAFGDIVVAEVKLTQMSVKHDPESPKFWRHWKQLQAYCKMLDTRKAELHIVHEVDWSFGAKPCPHCGKFIYRSHYHVWTPDGGEFKQSQVDDAWSMVRAYA